MTTEEKQHADAGRHERGVRPSALAEALRGIADGFDQQRPWFRPDELVMHTLRRAADELEKADAAVAAERERCAKLCEALPIIGRTDQEAFGFSNALETCAAEICRA